MADKLTGAQGAADASQVDAAAAENQSVRDLVLKMDEHAKRVSKAREDRFCTYQEEFARICAISLETQEMMANQLPLVYKLIRGLIPGREFVLPHCLMVMATSKNRILEAAAGVGGSPGAGSAEQEAGGGSNSPATISRICATLLEREELADHLSLLHKLIQELIPGAGAVAVAVAVAAGAGGSRGAGSPEQEAGGGSNSPVTITKPHRKRQRGVELKGPDHRSR